MFFVRAVLKSGREVVLRSFTEDEVEMAVKYFYAHLYLLKDLDLKGTLFIDGPEGPVQKEDF